MYNQPHEQEVQPDIASYDLQTYLETIFGVFAVYMFLQLCC